MHAQDVFRGLDPATQGDAPELLAKAKPADIVYPTFGMAMIALAPTDYEFECGRTAAQLRLGRTAWNRLKGEYPYSRHGAVKVVPPILCPDAKPDYGRGYDDIISWQGMNAKYSSLALEPLPLVLSPRKAKGFATFISLHQRLTADGYLFLSSCLTECDDVERLLRKVNRRTILPRVGAGALVALPPMARGAAGAAFLLALLIVALSALFFFGWGLVLGVNWVVDTTVAAWEATGAWWDREKWNIGRISLIVIVLGLAGWWVWPEEEDRGITAPLWRLFIVVALIAFVVMAVLAFGAAFAHIEARQ